MRSLKLEVRGWRNYLTIEKEQGNLSNNKVYEVTICFTLEEIIEEVRLRNDIIEVVSSYVKRNARAEGILAYVRFTMKDSFFALNRLNSFFYCFGCTRAEVLSSL